MQWLKINFTMKIYTILTTTPNFFNDTELKFVTDGYWKLYDEVLNKIEEFDPRYTYS